jgi:nucleotide-binding universal stress UspA family protein
MKNILLPVDFSENSKNAMRYAMAMFGNSPCNWTLVYANIRESDYVEKPSYQFGTNILVEKKGLAVEDKLNEMKAYLESISQGSVIHQISAEEGKGPFLDSIKKQVAEKKIHIIVMGTKGASELKEFFMGTHASEVISQVECDVLVVPDKAIYQGLKQVVLPVDFEISFSENTLGTLADFLPSEQTEIKVVYVTKSDIPLFKEVEMAQEQLRELLSEALPLPISFHRMVSKKIEDGVRIFAEKEGADLIIMFSKDYRLLQKVFLDTTVEEVSFDTKIPLLSLQA